MSLKFKLFIHIIIFLDGRLLASHDGADRISMSLEEKIGQLIVAPACPGRLDQQHVSDLEKAVQHWHVGGFLLKQGTLRETSDLIQRVENLSSRLLLIAADAEWGLKMRISDALKYPKNMTLGAIRDLELIEQVGSEIGEQMRCLGIHLNLAPVIDVNSNSRNPIIYIRSFGDDPMQVAKHGSAMIRGLQKTGRLACAKHFPGHGDTFTDSHVTLPCIEKNLLSLQQMELIPFKALIDQGVACIMTAHLLIPAVDDQPVTLSKLWVTDILREKLGFRGLIITDALNMEGIAKGRDAGEVAVQAFLAGHDLLLYGDHIAPKIDEILEQMIPTAINALKKAIEDGTITMAELDRRVNKILDAKQRLKTTKRPLHNSACSMESTLPKILYQQAITARGELPVLNLVQLMEIGPQRSFGALLEKEGVAVTDNADWQILVIGEIERGHAENKQAALQALEKVRQQSDKKVIVLFGSPYNLVYIPQGIPVLLAYEDTPEAWEAAALALAGKIPCPGHLPISPTKN